MPINFCTSCKVGLANEEVVNGVCERCGSEVIRKMQSQWMLKITDYADKLIEGLDHVDYIEKVKVSQKNWIGRSEGAEVEFRIKDKDETLLIYTTRPDTLFGATYMVISPEHPLIEKYKAEIGNYDEIAAYREQASKKSDFERTELAKDKTGVCINGISAINPVNNKEIPVWVSRLCTDVVRNRRNHGSSGTRYKGLGFCKRNLVPPIIEVVAGGDVQNEAFTDVATGKLCNSDFLNGMEVKDAKEAVTKWLEEKGIRA